MLKEFTEKDLRRLTLDGTGAAETQLTLPMQPGDNLRVAGLFETNNAQTHLDLLQVTNATGTFYVTNSNDQIKDFLGSVSPMLTVWRRLHIEVDSMDPVATTGAEANFQTGLIDSYLANAPVTGQSMLNLNIDLRGGNSAYENGQIQITNVGTFSVVKNNARWFVGDDVIISGTPGTNVIGKSFTIYDDDDRFLSTIGLAPALPKDGESTNIIQGIRPVFLPAYIDITNANAEGFNTTKGIAFKRNAAMGVFDGGAGVFADAKDLHDRSNFWAHTVTFGYQPEPSKDADPNSKDRLPGITLKGAFPFEGGVSAVYVELIREASIDFVVANQNLSQFYPEYRKEYTNWISGIVAHEIAHAPGNQSESSDHGEDGLMHKEGQSLTSFTGKTIKRFRDAIRWNH